MSTITKKTFFLILLVLVIGAVVGFGTIQPKPQMNEISLGEAFYKLQIAVDSAHFNRPKHQGDDPGPQDIKQTLRLGMCNPITVYSCATWTQRLKFVCPINAEVSIGLSMSIDTEDLIPLNVTAFPAVNPYWQTDGVAGCALIGTVIHP